MAEDLDERILDGFVSFRGVSEILIRDSQRPALMDDDELAKPLARPFGLVALQQFADFNRETRVFADLRLGCAADASRRTCQRRG